jgi:predicted nucleic acid-binding protein
VIVVDSSVLIPFFRGDESVGALRLREIEEQLVPFSIPAVCCQEVLQGAKDLRDWEELARCLETQELLAATGSWQTHSEAARIYFDCRRKGIKIGSSIGCLIAQLVLENDAVLLHEDADFERIKGVRPLRTVAL